MARPVSAGPRANPPVEHLRDVSRGFGPVDARRVFGGYEVCHRGLTIAIVVGDVLYLKADAQHTKGTGVEFFGVITNRPRYFWITNSKPPRFVSSGSVQPILSTLLSHGG